MKRKKLYWLSKSAGFFLGKNSGDIRNQKLGKVKKIQMEKKFGKFEDLTLIKVHDPRCI